MRAASGACASPALVTPRLVRRKTAALVPIVFGGICFLAAVTIAIAAPFMR
jgi:hypothetical protein